MSSDAWPCSPYGRSTSSSTYDAVVRLLRTTGISSCNLCLASASVQQCWSGWARRLHQTSSQNPGPTSAGPSPAGSADRAVFFSGICGIGTRDPMFGPLPRHSQAAEGHTNGFVADQARRQALGKTDLGGQRERPPAGGFAEGPRTLVQQRPEGLAGASVEDGRRRVGRDERGCSTMRPRWWNA